MALGDEIEVLIDVGGAKPLTERVTATGAGGSVDAEYDGPLVHVREYGKGKKSIRRSVTVGNDRLVALIMRPKR